MSKKGIVIIFALISVFLFVNGVANFGQTDGSEFVSMGVLLLGLLLIVMLTWKVINYLAEEKVFVLLYCIKEKMMIAETAGLAVFLLAGLITRIVVAIKVKTPIEIKEFEHTGILFPGETLYQNITAVFGNFSGGSIASYELLNIVASVVSMVLIYLIVRTMYGRSGGLVSLALSALWPSHIYGVVYDSEKYLCTMLFLAAVYFFILFRRTKYWPVFSVLAGVMLGILAYLQTSMYILFIVFIISPFIKGEEGRERTFGENLLKRIPAAAISIVVAFLVITITNSAIAKDLGIASSKITSIDGYAVLSGFNLEAGGNENEEDYSFLMENYEEGENPKDAQNVCLRAGFERFATNKAQSINLLLKKAQYIFGCGYDLPVRVELSKSNFIYLEDAYYLLVLLGTGIFAVEMLQRNHRGYINFVIVMGILTVLSGAMFMIEGTVQMEFGYIMAICSGAIISILYRRGLGDETIRTIEEITRKQEEAAKKEEKWKSKLQLNQATKEAMDGAGEDGENDPEYYFDEEELVDNSQVEEDIQNLLSKLSIDTSQMNTESVKEKRKKRIEEAKEKQKNKANDEFDV